MKPAPLLLINVGQLLTLRSAQRGPRRGSSLSEIDFVKDAAVLCLGGKIVSIGTAKDALRDPWLKKNRKKVTEIDCGGRIVSHLMEQTCLRAWALLLTVITTHAT